jgi:alpha-beta hydrolase superfamily lysophospholipase
MNKKLEGDGFFKTADGKKLHYRSWVCARAKAVFLVVHGIGEHIGRYEYVSTAFMSRGYSVCGFDLRGHGLSEGKRGDIEDFSLFVSDIKDFYEFVKSFSTEKIFILGHSFGGLLALLCGMNPPGDTKGIISINPLIRFKMELPRHKLVLGNLLRAVLPSFTFSNGIKIRHLSKDQAVVDAYRKDKLVHDRISVRLFFQMLKQIEALKSSIINFKMPLLFLLSGDDRIIDSGASKEFFDKIESKDKKLIILEGFYHEPLNEIGKERVFEEIESWVEQYL